MPQLFKNTASQKLRVFAFADAGHASLDAGEPVTGDAANITAQTALDDGALGASNDTNPAEVDATNAPGYYEFDPTQAETNGDVIEWYPQSSTAGVQVKTVGGDVQALQPPNLPALGIESDGHVHGDVKEWKGTAPAALTDTDKLQVSLQHGANDVITQSMIAADAIGSSELAAAAADKIRDAILDRFLVGNHDGPNTPGSFLQQLNDSVSSRSSHNSSDAADAVLNRVLSGNHDTSGTTGEVLQAIVADTNELQSDDVPGLIAALNDFDPTSDTVDGITYESWAECLLAVLTGQATVSGSDVIFRKRDGTTAKMTITYTATDGERSGSAINN